MRPFLLRHVSVATAVLVLGACPQVRRPELRDARLVPARGAAGQPLKVHLRSGQLLVLAAWSDLPGDSGLRGTGHRFDAARRSLGRFDGRVARDSIALLEVTHTSTARPVGSAILGYYTVAMGIITTACMADPKACFGSCPTFYVADDDDRPVAEGFSGSVARSLEATDVDALPETAGGGRFAITMRNEALETHVVRSVRLYALPAPASGFVAADRSGRFYVLRDVVPPSCRAADGSDCTAPVASRDGVEWSTRADSADLGRPDSLELTFAQLPERAMLVTTSRQTFVSTYVFYQALAWAGSRAGELLAAVERDGIAAFPAAWEMMQRLSRIDVMVRTRDGAWRAAGTTGEPGPIAADRAVLTLPDDVAVPLVVRLRFARGALRFDELAVAAGEPAEEVRRLDPVRVERDGSPDGAALERLRDPERYLVTNPGDRYRIVFELPQRAGRWALFLESTGHYYEWMRPEWLREENPAMLALLATRPDDVLRRIAPGYARLEPELERMFWASRFGRN
jgi:hypothetical protein